MLKKRLLATVLTIFLVMTSITSVVATSTSSINSDQVSIIVDGIPVGFGSDRTAIVKDGVIYIPVYDTWQAAGFARNIGIMWAKNYNFISFAMDSIVARVHYNVSDDEWETNYSKNMFPKYCKQKVTKNPGSFFVVNYNKVDKYVSNITTVCFPIQVIHINDVVYFPIDVFDCFGLSYDKYDTNTVYYKSVFDQQTLKTVEDTGNKPDVTTVPTPILTEQQGNFLTLKIGEKYAYNNWESFIVPIAPRIINDYAFAPFSPVAKALGATVTWNNKTKTVTAIKDDITVTVTIGSSTAYVNDIAVKLPAIPQIIDDYTFVPSSFIAQAFGGSSTYDGNTQTVVMLLPVGDNTSS